MIPLNEKYNFRSEFWKLYIRNSKVDLNSISPLNAPLVSAINGLSCREVDIVYTVLAARKIIYNITGGEDIKVNPIQLYNDPKITKMINVELVESRLKAIDITFALPYYKQDPESSGYNFINLKDDATINKINAKYFANNPLDLSRL
jgi:hypothetical protein